MATLVANHANELAQVRRMLQEVDIELEVQTNMYLGMQACTRLGMLYNDYGEFGYKRGFLNDGPEVPSKVALERQRKMDVAAEACDSQKSR